MKCKNKECPSYNKKSYENCAHQNLKYSGCPNYMNKKIDNGTRNIGRLKNI